MAAFDYSRLAATSNRLITRFGKTCVLEQPGAATGSDPYDPTPGAPASYPTKAVLMDFDLADITAGRVLASDKRALVSAKGVAGIPDPSWFLRFNEPPVVLDANGNPYQNFDGTANPKDYTIVMPKPLQPGSMILLFDMQVRS
jgi:hypothetical protein